MTVAVRVTLVASSTEDGETLKVITGIESTVKESAELDVAKPFESVTDIVI